jgi:isoleucyl-tRNA synthetase
MREQIRLWFYSQLFMAVALTGRAPFREVLCYEKMLDERGQEMHGSWGNMIEAEDAFAKMGADVMRWQYSAQPPNQNLLFGYGPGREIKRKLLTLWNSVSFLVSYANIAGFTPEYADLDRGPAGDAPALDRWLDARTCRLVEEATAGYEASLSSNVIRAFESFVDDLSNWYIRRSRRRFYDDGDEALLALWRSLVQGVRVISPILPFLAEHLWQRLVTDVCEAAPDSVFLAGWPETSPYDAALLAEMQEARRVVELGRQARSASGLKVRQPLRQLYVRGAPLARAHAQEIGDELRVKAVGFDEGPVAEVTVKPNLRVLGPRLGPKMAQVQAALREGSFEELPGGEISAAGERLAADEVLREERVSMEGWSLAHEGSVSVALDTSLDDELRLEGRVYDRIRQINEMRKDAGLELTDRIALRLPASDSALLPHAEWIEREVLAVELRVDDAVAEPRIEKA